MPRDVLQVVHATWAQLGIDPSETVAWRSGNQSGSVTATIPVEGAPPGIQAHITIDVPIADTYDEAAGLRGHIQFRWGKHPIYRLDLSGPPHLNLKGRPIGTPHFQFVTQLGTMDAEGVASDEFATLDESLRWFLKRIDIEGVPRWNDPPQLPLRPIP